MFVPLSFGVQIPLFQGHNPWFRDPKPKGTNPKGTKENSLKGSGFVPFGQDGGISGAIAIVGGFHGSFLAGYGWCNIYTTHLRVSAGHIGTTLVGYTLANLLQPQLQARHLKHTPYKPCDFGVYS